MATEEQPKTEPSTKEQSKTEQKVKLSSTLNPKAAEFKLKVTAKPFVPSFGLPAQPAAPMQMAQNQALGGSMNMQPNFQMPNNFMGFQVRSMRSFDFFHFFFSQPLLKLLVCLLKGHHSAAANMGMMPAYGSHMGQASPAGGQIVFNNAQVVLSNILYADAYN